MAVTSTDHTSGVLRARPEQIAAPAAATPGRHPLDLDGRRDGAFLVPAGLDPAKPAPLIVALHGAGGIARQVLDLLAMQAERHGIIVLAPESRGSTWVVIRGGYGPDVAFIDRALAKILSAPSHRSCPHRALRVFRRCVLWPVAGSHQR